MKAIINNRYGTPDILELREIEKPQPGDHQVLIKVLAASVNKADWYILTGSPFPIRFMSGFSKPKYRTLGADVSGIVERVGSNVNQFKPGDEVFGDLSANGFGGFAEYALTDESKIAIKPTNFNFAQAAAIPMAAITALQALRDKGKIAEGQQVLINGASGGVGTYAIQIAKYFGSQVTAVCSTAKAGRAKRLGADFVIDYKTNDFTREDKEYDLILDIVGNHPVSSVSKVLKKGGHYVTCVFSLGALLLGPWKKLTEKKTITNVLTETNRADLQFLTKLVEEEKLNPVIDETYTLDDVPEALRKMGKGSNEGKLVICI
ncbi:MAG: NAD(P)-dependent alcohol dehydrogenase [Saprospiraceae bacterium]|nr:NAD(P)-dependent alcohol dehydrogenase [Saprospiraceae bacterium]